jgi:hypothetical protein
MFLNKTKEALVIMYKPSFVVVSERPAAVMDNPGRWNIPDLAAGQFYAFTQVSLLEIHEIRFIESADGINGAPTDKKA